MNDLTNTIEIELKEYLQNMVTLRQAYARNKTKYSCFEELVLDCGLIMIPQTFPAAFESGLPKSCYWNCQKLAFEHSSLTYVEGYALHADVGFPVAHAWLLYQGQAIDPTWESLGSCYFGIPLSTKWVKSVLEFRKTISKIDDLSIFEGNYLERFSLLKDGIPPNAIIGKL
ncbi:hypothetical protein [Phormidium nigroviride]